MQQKIIDAKLTYRLKTLSLLFNDGKSVNLPFNYLQKQAGTDAAIVNMKLESPAQITLYFADNSQYLVEID